MPRLLATGSNGHGQLGIAHRDDVSRFTPCLFSDGRNPLEDSTVRVLSLVSGGNHSLLLLTSARGRNEIWVTGSNRHGELGPGIGPSVNVWTPLDLAAVRGAAGLVEEGTIYEPVAIGCTWSSTFIAFSRSLISDSGLRISDVIVSFGSNDFGELGCGEITRDSSAIAGKANIVRIPGWDAHDSRSRMRVQQIATGQRHIVCLCVISTDGHEEQTVYGWGAARHGQLSTSTHSETSNDTSHAGPSREPIRRAAKYPTTHTTPTQLDIRASLALASSISHIACGASHTVLCTSAGALITLGSNAKRQRDVPMSCTAVACTWNGTVGWDEKGAWAVGSNTHGQLGRRQLSSVSATENDYISFDDLATPVHIQSIVCGSEHTLLLTQQGTLYAWGWNEHGNLGVGSLEDQWTPRRVSVSGEDGGVPRVRGVWAGCGTSWVLVDDRVWAESP
ncbi:hypothetical protein NliqN6_2442 [Naganishia liquefaciens]|uniref:RCC1-like domain-containing protein n=1 Tax=Naganishia liquefaciens TaxID=104408 RepID=A0A8H3TSW1_9TREE|nr:hypothetical protein NliqN6_2442 [Naganishia liquefaciens]